MAAATMSLELHERGIHAVWTGGPRPRPGGTGVTGARQDAPAPENPETARHQGRRNVGFNRVGKCPRSTRAFFCCTRPRVLCETASRAVAEPRAAAPPRR